MATRYVVACHESGWRGRRRGGGRVDEVGSGVRGVDVSTGCAHRGAGVSGGAGGGDGGGGRLGGFKGCMGDVWPGVVVGERF